MESKAGTVVVVILIAVWALGVWSGMTPGWPINLVLNILAGFGIGYGTSGGLYS